MKSQADLALSAEGMSLDPPTRVRSRLLPWTGLDGKPAYLRTDSSGESPLSQLADMTEANQIAHAQEVLTLSGRPEAGVATADELRWVINRLRESLVQVLRIADSREGRL